MSLKIQHIVNKDSLPRGKKKEKGGVHWWAWSVAHCKQGLTC
jgi:hypothetical protein